jgi:hypothetical protein
MRQLSRACRNKRIVTRAKPGLARREPTQLFELGTMGRRGLVGEPWGPPPREADV